MGKPERLQITYKITASLSRVTASSLWQAQGIASLVSPVPEWVKPKRVIKNRFLLEKTAAISIRTRTIKLSSFYSISARKLHLISFSFPSNASLLSYLASLAFPRQVRDIRDAQIQRRTNGLSRKSNSVTEINIMGKLKRHIVLCKSATLYVQSG